jgi:hypothetical protein
VKESNRIRRTRLKTAIDEQQLERDVRLIKARVLFAFSALAKSFRSATKATDVDDHDDDDDRDTFVTLHVTNESTKNHHHQRHPSSVRLSRLLDTARLSLF